MATVASRRSAFLGYSPSQNGYADGCEGSRRGHLELPAAAIPVAASRLRQQFAEWLRKRGIGSECVNEIILGVNEALANCIDHTYVNCPAAGVMTLQAKHDAEAKSVSVRVIDHGTWQSRSAGYCNEDRGRGIVLMDAMADQCIIEGRPEGTTVCMEWSVDGEAV